MKSFNSRILDNARASVEHVNTDTVLRSLGLMRRPRGMQTMLPAASYLLVGAAVGAGIALLFAPKTGRQVRKELKARTREAREQLSETADRVAQGMSDLAHEKSKIENSVKTTLSSAKAPPHPQGS